MTSESSMSSNLTYVRDDIGRATLPGLERVSLVANSAGDKILFVSLRMPSEGHFVFGAFGFCLLSAIVTRGLWEVARLLNLDIIDAEFPVLVACWLVIAVVCMVLTSLGAALVLTRPALAFIARGSSNESIESVGGDIRVEVARASPARAWVAKLPLQFIRDRLLVGIAPSYSLKRFIVSPWCSVRVKSPNVDFARIAGKLNPPATSQPGAICVAAEVVMLNRPHAKKTHALMVSILGMPASKRSLKKILDFATDSGIEVDVDQTRIVVSGRSTRRQPDLVKGKSVPDQSFDAHRHWLEIAE